MNAKWVIDLKICDGQGAMVKTWDTPFMQEVFRQGKWRLWYGSLTISKLVLLGDGGGNRIFRDGFRICIRDV